MRSAHKIGQVSVAQAVAASGVVDTDTLNEVVEENQTGGERVMDILIARDLVTEFDLVKILSQYLQLPFLSPQAYDVPDEVKTIIPQTTLHAHRVIPLGRYGRILTVATTGDIDTQAISAIERESGYRLQFFIAMLSQIQRVLNEDYPLEGLGEEVANRMDELFGG